MRLALRLASAALMLATPLLSNAQPTPGVCRITDLTLNLTACVGAFGGNSPKGSINTFLSANAASWGTGWSYLGSSDDAGFGPFTGNPSTNTGTLAFDTPLTGSFIIALKGAPAFALYRFDNITTPVASLQYTMANIASNNPGLSHADLYVRPTTVVPEPSSYALIATGLAGLTIAARRRRRA